MNTMLLSVIPWYVGGVVTGQVVTWFLVRRNTQKDSNTMKDRRFPYQAIIFVVVLAVLGYIMVSTNQARDCAIKLNTSVSTEQDISKIERDALANAILKSQAVPQEIQDLPQNDPARKAVFDPITAEYLAATKHAADLRIENKALRDEAQRACGH